MFASIEVTDAERAAPRPGDDLVAPADVVMDRAVGVDAPPAEVWPWLAQLGKRRAGWYLPRTVERLLPRGRRATRRLHPGWVDLAVGDVVPDYGGPRETFTVARLEPPHALVYTSTRGHTAISWSISLEPTPTGTRIFFRLRLSPVRRRWLAESVGDWFDALTIAGMAGGLRERVADGPRRLSGGRPTVGA